MQHLQTRNKPKRSIKSRTFISIARPVSNAENVKTINMAMMAKPPGPKLFMLISMQTGHKLSKPKKTDNHFRIKVGFL